MSTANLERVRRIKNRLVRLTTRVETLREVLEKILDDDSDMHQMNLTARAMDLLERQARPSADPVPIRKEETRACRCFYIVSVCLYYYNLNHVKCTF